MAAAAAAGPAIPSDDESDPEELGPVRGPQLPPLNPFAASPAAASPTHVTLTAEMFDRMMQAITDRGSARQAALKDWTAETYFACCQSPKFSRFLPSRMNMLLGFLGGGVRDSTSQLWISVSTMTSRSLRQICPERLFFQLRTRRARRSGQHSCMPFCARS